MQTDGEKATDEVCVRERGAGGWQKERERSEKRSYGSETFSGQGRATAMISV